MDMKVNSVSTITENSIGIEDGYNWELWREGGSTSMTLNGGGRFSCSWTKKGNALFRKGKKYDVTKTHDQLGNIIINYVAESNNSYYLTVYGWSKDPLIEYYILDSWGSERPSSYERKGIIEIDGGTYEIYKNTRVDGHSIDGITTFTQYGSVRTEPRTSGTISVSEHFKAWEKLGLNLGKMYEISLLIESDGDSGNVEIKDFNLIEGKEMNPKET